MTCSLNGGTGESAEIDGMSKGGAGTALGAVPATGNWPFVGRLDDVLFLNRKLSVDELETYYYSGEQYGTQWADPGPRVRRLCAPA